MCNLGTNPRVEGGSCTAAAFLWNFVKDKENTKWMHWDIASGSADSKFNATGHGVLTWIEFFKNKQG